MYKQGFMKKNLQSFTEEIYKKFHEEIEKEDSLNGKEIATKKMLAIGMDVEMIKKITNFSIEEILNIKQNM